jgi:ElaB/YqjD/DUF883 family membrane-anchored ribosome-binding protein
MREPQCSNEQEGAYMNAVDHPTDESHSQAAREHLLADFKAIAAEAEALLNATKGDTSEKARETRARLASALDKAKANYQNVKAESFAAAEEALSKADRTIRAHPYEAIGIAFGVGVLLGALLQRK